MSDTVINYDRPSPGLCEALREFYHARKDFARLSRTPRTAMIEMDRASDRITRAEDWIEREIDRMRVPVAQGG